MPGVWAGPLIIAPREGDEPLVPEKNMHAILQRTKLNGSTFLPNPVMISLGNGMRRFGKP